MIKNGIKIKGRLTLDDVKSLMEIYPSFLNARRSECFLMAGNVKGVGIR